MRDSCSFQFWGVRIAGRNYFGIIFYFITDTDTEKYYFRIISAMNSDKRYCWEFHGSGTISEKRGVPSRTEGERILEMLWKPQMPWIIGLWGSQLHFSRGIPGNPPRAFPGLVFPDIFPEFLAESPSRAAHNIFWGKKMAWGKFSLAGEVTNFPSSRKNSFLSNPSFHGKRAISRERESSFQSCFQGKNILERQKFPSQG